MKTALGLLFAMGVVACGAGKPTSGPAPKGSGSPATSSSAPLATPAVEPAAGEIDGRPELVSQLVGGRDAWSAYSADGKLAITLLGSSFGLVEIDTGRVRGVLPVECVEEAAFSADNRFVVFSDCGDRGDGVHVWDLARNEVKDTTLHLRGARFVPQEQGHRVLVHSDKSEAAVVELWSLALTELELPVDARLQGARFAADGRIVLFGRNGVFHFAEGANAPTATSFGPSDGVVAADADLKRDRVVVLFEDGRGSVIDPATAKVISSQEVCRHAAAKDVYFASLSTDVVVQCGTAVSKLDATLGSAKQYFQDDSRKDFTVRPVGRRLFVSTWSEVSVFDLVDGSWGDAMKLDHAVTILADGARVAMRDGSRVLDSTTGKDIWAPERTLPGQVTELRAKAALLGKGDAIDLRTGQAFDFSSLSDDGAVVMKTIIMPDRDGRLRATVAVADRDTGAAWSFDTDPGERPELAPSGKFVVFQTTDPRTRSTSLMVHGPRTSRRVDTPDYPALTLNDLFLVSEYVNDRYQYRIGALATGSLETARWHYESSLRFAAGGTRLVLDGELHDTATRGLAWKVPEGEAIHWFAQDSDLVVVGAADRGPAKPLRVLSAKDGKEVAQVARGGVVRAASNKRLLLERDGGLVVTDGAIETPVSLQGRLARSPMRLSNDDAIVWYQRSDRLVAAHRTADGRELLIGLDAAPITDEGVFDPSDAARVRLLVRSGPNLLESRFSSVTEAPAKYGHPGLVQDFFAGAAVSPRP